MCREANIPPPIDPPKYKPDQESRCFIGVFMDKSLAWAVGTTKHTLTKAGKNFSNIRLTKFTKTRDDDIHLVKIEYGR